MLGYISCAGGTGPAAVTLAGPVQAGNACDLQGERRTQCPAKKGSLRSAARTDGPCLDLSHRLAVNRVTIWMNTRICHLGCGSGLALRPFFYVRRDAWVRPEHKTNSRIAVCILLKTCVFSSNTRNPRTKILGNGR